MTVGTAQKKQIARAAKEANCWDLGVRTTPSLAAVEGASTWAGSATGTKTVPTARTSWSV